VRVAVLALLGMHARWATAADDSQQYSLSAGLQASYFRCYSACIYNGNAPRRTEGSVDGGALNNFTLSGTANLTSEIKLSLAGEYTGSGSAPGSDQFDLLAGIVRLEFLDQSNMWIGRFYAPSDRVNLAGPFFTNDLAPFRNGVDDDYPQARLGSDDGIAYWGDFNMLKLSVGGFEGRSLTNTASERRGPLVAARLMLDFWDKEEGYLLRSTFYGDSNILALGVAAQSENGRSAWDVDGLLERRLRDSGVITCEFEYQQDRRLSERAASRGWFLLTSYLVPQRLGPGQLQPLLKYSEKSFDASALPAYTLRTLEANLNYIINGANALVGLYYLKQRDVLLGLGAQPPRAGEYSFIDPQEVGLKIQVRI
jgi:hypothetical protein